MKRIFICLLVVFSVTFNSKIFAYGSEVGRATPYYSHPITGIIEDAGNNPEIGQGMTENVLHKQAFLEEVDGAYYLTVRFNLASNIKNETFAVQVKGDSDFYSTQAEIVQTNGDTRDYRFEIPSKNVIIRSSFFVEPMGRDIIFYFDVDNFVEGNTDFITMDEDNLLEEESLNNEIHGKSEIEKLKLGPTVNFERNSNSIGEKIETKSVNSNLSSEELGYSHGLLMKDSPELKKLLGEDGDLREKKDLDKRPLGFITKAFIGMILGVVSLITVFLAFAAVASILYLKRLRLENYRMVEEDED
ncbi:MAG: heme-binding Shp domain-containing protein [Peptoniphilus sp.]|uniref:heme-binding Shp domain-containing protein n=1 Tax=Peptoniphilus sp. TaxID=1971214 RepID=UPI002A76227F|nr:heme-binding Shp domain-containing protein [Peptoniphilus sp.]MDY2986908.1 heme-binding Shp domain-containing protein [Peptoniphilus sp.]